MILTALRPTEEPLRQPHTESPLPPSGPLTRETDGQNQILTRQWAGAQRENSLSPIPGQSSPCKSLQTFAPAKINLTLEVLGCRPDGYHELRSLVVAIGLYDRMCATVTADPKISLDCSDVALSGPANLAHKAAQQLIGRSGGRGLHIQLHKRIPIGSGLGGGSSDAAAALRLCNELWDLNRSRDELATLGSQVGSDVAFFFHPPSALMTGRGEIVRPLSLAWNGHAVLVFPGIPVSTASVYAAWQPSDAATTERQPTTALAERIAVCRTAAAIAALTVNQLEPALFRVAPALRELFDLLVSLNLGRPRVSGSGSAMYLLFDDLHSAALAASAISTSIPQVEAVTAAAPVGEVPVDCKQ